MTDNDIDAIRQRADRYKQTGAGSGKTIQAIQLANTDVPALLAKVDELTAEREHMEMNPTGTAEWLKNRVNELTAERDGLRDEIQRVERTRQEQLVAANRHADGLKADLRSATTANTAYANENARLRSELAEADVVIGSMRAAIDEADAEAATR